MVHWFDNAHYFYNEKISDCNGIRAHNHLVRKRTINHLVNYIYSQWENKFDIISKYEFQF